MTRWCTVATFAVGAFTGITGLMLIDWLLERNGR